MIEQCRAILSPCYLTLIPIRETLESTAPSTLIVKETVDERFRCLAYAVQIVSIRAQGR